MQHLEQVYKQELSWHWNVQFQRYDTIYTSLLHSLGKR